MRSPVQPWLAGLTGLILCLSLSACEMKLPPMPWDPPPKPDAAHEEEAATEEEGGGGAEIEPVDLSKLLPEAMRDLPALDVTIPMRDKLTLYGKLYDPTLKKDEEGETTGPGDEEAEYTGPKYPLVILLHGLNKTNGTWQDLPARLVKAGYAVYAVDLRGHGKSNRLGRSGRINWRLMSADDWKLLPQDVDQAIKYFQKGEDIPEVDAQRVVLIGEKLGANVATLTVKKNKEALKALVLLSPVLSAKGLDATVGLRDFTNPTLILASEDEKETYTDARHLYNWLTGPKTLQIYNKSGLGTDMLVNKPSIGDQIRDWLVQKMPPGGASAPSAAEPTGHAAAEEHAPADKPAAEDPAHKG